MAKQSVYVKRLSLSQKEKDEKQLKFQERKTKLQVEASLLATQETLAEKEQELEDAKSKFPLNLEVIGELISEIAAAQEGLEVLEGLQEELFAEA